MFLSPMRCGGRDRLRLPARRGKGHSFRRGAVGRDAASPVPRVGEGHPLPRRVRSTALRFVSLCGCRRIAGSQAAPAGKPPAAVSRRAVCLPAARLVAFKS